MGGVPAEAATERAPSSTFRAGGRERAPFPREEKGVRVLKGSAFQNAYTGPIVGWNTTPNVGSMKRNRSSAFTPMLFVMPKVVPSPIGT